LIGTLSNWSCQYWELFWLNDKHQRSTFQGTQRRTKSDIDDDIHLKFSPQPLKFPPKIAVSPFGQFGSRVSLGLGLWFCFFRNSKEQILE
jgi:hypothetical protein